MLQATIVAIVSLLFLARRWMTVSAMKKSDKDPVFIRDNAPGYPGIIAAGVAALLISCISIPLFVESTDINEAEGLKVGEGFEILYSDEYGDDGRYEFWVIREDGNTMKMSIPAKDTTVIYSPIDTLTPELRTSYVESNLTPKQTAFHNFYDGSKTYELVLPESARKESVASRYESGTHVRVVYAVSDEVAKNALDHFVNVQTSDTD